ncbi:alpha/beta fold hydrolase [Microbacterium sp. K24]|uniref:alpha/beta fold hydrolase n=1 Tax=Microbacterium sp. K24 TaxID=2305446 RepID=UPI00109D2338|nr:alpha/beta fold hydrolase [Microbacterium sp. K24]
MAPASEPIDIDVEHVTTNGATTRVVRIDSTAPENRRPFVLVAGVGVAASYFEFLAPTLAERGDVYALDLPGFAGMARADGRQPTISFFADQVEAVLDRYDLRDPVLIGHSMGTQVVTEVLTRRPDLTHAVLVSPVVDEQEATVFRQALRFVRSATRESLHLAVIAVSAYLLCGPVYFLRVLPHMLRYRITERVGAVESSLLFIRGEFDATSTRRFHSRLVSAAKNASRWEIEGASHSIINGHAVGVAKLTLQHIAGELAAKGRLADEDAVTPPPARVDAALVRAAVAARVDEWVSALRRDERGVERAKERHAHVLWLAYRRTA